MNEENKLLMPEELITDKIYLIRGQKVIIDHDLAKMYGVETKQLKRQVNRNKERFPEDFMFVLTQKEQEILRCQIGTFNGVNAKYLAYVFTEQGVAMLSSVLNSKQAIQVNIQIIRVFTRLRQMLQDNTELRLAIEEIRKKTENNSKSIEWRGLALHREQASRLVFKYLDELLDKKENPKPATQIGFKINS